MVNIQEILNETELKVALLTDDDCIHIQRQKSVQKLEELEKYDSGSHVVQANSDGQGSDRFNKVQICILVEHILENWDNENQNYEF